MVAISIENLHRFAVEHIAILAKHVGIGPVAGNGIGGQHEDVLHLLDADEQADPLAGPEPPERLHFAELCDGPRLVFEWHDEAERTTVWIDGVGDVRDAECLPVRVPPVARLFFEIDLDRPAFLYDPFQQRRFVAERPPLDGKHLVIRQQRQRLPSLHLLTEFDLQLLNLERIRD